MGWKCFLTEPSPFHRESLRRYAGSSKCNVSKHGYHNAEVIIAPQVPQSDLGGRLPDEDDRRDPRWPALCGCGYPFAVGDSWQMNSHRLYQGSPDGVLYVLNELPAGAMWVASWLTDFDDGKEVYAGPDGKAWCVMLPCRVEFIVYGYSSIDGEDGRLRGPKWTVTGAPPAITVRPSIGMTGFYHGYITDGVIEEDVEGRKFEGVPRTA